MKVKKLILGYFNVNCYVVSAGNFCFIIDPGADFEAIESYLKSENLKPDFILNTHGHYDHIGAVPETAGAYKIPFYIHKEDEIIITDPDKNFSSVFTQNPLSLKTYNLIDEKALKLFDGLSIEIFNMPGHTPGSIIIKADKSLFTGDLLFRGGVGRTDLFGGNSAQMDRSLKKLRNFDPGLAVYPGHGANSALGYELRNNYFLNNQEYL